MKIPEAKRALLEEMGRLVSLTDKSRVDDLSESLVQRFGFDVDIEAITELEWLMFQGAVDGSMHPTKSAALKSLVNSMLQVAQGKMVDWPSTKMLPKRLIGAQDRLEALERDRRAQERRELSKQAQRIQVPRLDEDGNFLVVGQSEGGQL